MRSQLLLRDLSQLGVKLSLGADNQLSVSAPKGSLSSSLLDRIRECKLELIDLLAQNKGSEGLDGSPFVEADLQDHSNTIPLADLQTAFFMGQREDMEYYVRPHYYVEKEFLSLDVDRYERALNAALYRQRKNLLILTDDIRLQALPDFIPVKLEVRDLRDFPDDEAEEVLRTLREDLCRRILPLDRWPWIECSISLYGEHKARLHFNNNNFFSDGWGGQKLLDDVLRHYHNPDEPLPELSLTYPDCVRALARLEESTRGETSKKYWLSRLATMPGPPAIPLKVGVNPRQRSRLVRRHATLPKGVWAAFKEAANQHGVTPSNALFAAYSEVLACWSGSRHFRLNNMVTHRLLLQPEVKEVLGNFASLYPLEVDWRDKVPFHERAGKLQSQIMSDLEHVYWSGVKVLQALNHVQKAPGRAACPFVIGSGLFMEPRDKPFFSCLETPQALLDHQFWELKDGGLWIVWDLIETCFPDGMIDAMWEMYYQLLMRLANEEGAWEEADFDLLPAAQRQQRIQMNDTKASLPEGLLHEGLEFSATRFPNKLAVITPDRRLTFSELNAHANRLARWLQAEGAQPGELIAVLLNKGWEQVAAVYGILCSGAAYVPIDPNWPEARIHFLLDHIQAKRVITDIEVRAKLNLPNGVRALCIDDDETKRYSDLPLPRLQKQSDLAYIIFTSGSTGVPKGVMIDHQGALNTIADINQRFGISDSDVLFGISALYFDLSVYDVFGSMAAGATLILPEASDTPNPDAWLESIDVQGVTIMNSVPALMQLLLDAGAANSVTLPSLRTIMLSGDWIPTSMPAQIRRVAPQSRVISLGGATEASIWSIYFPIDKPDPAWVSIPYGRPLANQSWHVLNDGIGDAPTWVPGDLYIGGVGLAQGYWRDEEKTNAAFVRHPKTGERIYRTGDLGRFLPDGNIEFLGRADFQVKIQGLRVELGEIEHALLKHADVQKATVIASASGAGKQLIAFIVAAEGAKEGREEILAEFLRGELPSYMIPSLFVSLTQMPLTGNGKVDRQELVRLVAGAQQEKKQAYVAPRTPMEAALVRIWEDVLSVKDVSVHDNFFELGGQSFAAVRVMTRVAKEFGKRLPLSALLEGGTVAGLALCLQQESAWSPLVPMRVAGDGSPCFFVHPALGNVLCYRQIAESLGRPFYGLQAAGLNGEQTLLDKVEDMAALYVTALRQVQSHGPYILGGWSSGGVISFEIARQLEAMGETVARVIMLDAPAPMQHQPVDDKSFLLWFLEDLNIGFDPSWIQPGDSTEGSLDERLVAALALAKKRRESVMQLEGDQLQSIFAVFRGIVTATRRYRPGPIRAEISVLRAAEGRVSEFGDHPAAESEDWGWGKLTMQGVSSRVVPGTHNTMLAPPNEGALLDALRLELAEL